MAKEEKPSPLMYTFVIMVFIVGATFAICHKNFTDKKNSKELVGKTDTEKKAFYVEKLTKEYNVNRKDVSNKSVVELEKRLDYEMGEDSNNLVTAMIMIFFVLIAVMIAIFKFIATALFGLRSLNNIRRNI